MLRRHVLCTIFCLSVAFASHVTLAQQKPTIAGNYAGTLGPLHLKLHLTASANGTLTGTMDSPDQDTVGLQCSDIHFDGKALSFSVPSVHGTWSGTVGNDGELLSGTWNQGAPLPLSFTRYPFIPAAKPSPVDGIWLGTIHAGPQTLRIQITVKSDKAGHEYCTLDSLDQHAMGLECANVVLHGSDFSFDVPIVHGHWSGKFAADDKTLMGTWDQGGQVPLIFQRQSSAIL